MTLRDETWHIAILLRIAQLDSFKRSELPFDESERHTVGRVLNWMEEHGWLYREHERGQTWHPGVVALALFGDEPLSPDEHRELMEHLQPIAERLECTPEEALQKIRAD